MNTRSTRRRAPLLAAAAILTLTLLIRPAEAPAGLEEMYRSLPKPDQRCDDPIAGTWVGHAIYNGERYRLSMFIEREQPGEKALKGEITAEIWDMETDTPQPCERDNQLHTLLTMPAEGEVEPASDTAKEGIAFAGQSWSRTKHWCGPAGSYVPDAFTGTLADTDRILSRWYGVQPPAHTRAEIERGPGSFFATEVEFRRTACASTPPSPVPDLPTDQPVTAPSSRCGCF